MANLNTGLAGAASGAGAGSAFGPIGTAIGGLIGGLGGLFGASNAPTPTQIVSPYTSQDAQNATQQSLLTAQQQQAFLNQLAAQNGTANQSNVFNQLQGVAAGTGPNPAQAMLNQQTGTNVANQAALMAGQRGAGANPALLARQIAMQGANTQQQALGQAATLQAQQQLNALGQMGGIAGQQVGQQQAALGQLQGANLAQQQAILNSISGANQANVSAQTPLNTINQTAQNAGVAGAIGGAGAALPVLANAFKSSPSAPIQTAAQAGANSPEAMGGYQATAHGGEISHTAPKRSFLYRHAHPEFTPTPTTPMASGGKVPVMLSPGEKYLPPKAAEAVAEGRKNPMDGQTVPGKAKVSGDSLKNDIVPAKLEEGGIVIPRSVLQSKNPAAAAAKFVKDHLSKKSK